MSKSIDDILGVVGESFDRRVGQRYQAKIPISVSLAAKSGALKINGETTDLGNNGFSCELELEVPESTQIIIANFHSDLIPFSGDCQLIWRDPKSKKYGLRIRDLNKNYFEQDIYPRIESDFSKKKERRREIRRNLTNSLASQERRKADRRFTEIWKAYNLPKVKKEKAKVLLKNKFFSFDPEIIQERRNWLEEEKGISLKNVGYFSEPAASMRGNVENVIGVSHVPLGIAGPLRIEGEEAMGDFYVPLATSEGALVSSYAMGMNIITRSGGARTKVLFDKMRVSPVFVFENLKKAEAFILWAKKNFARIKEIAEKTTKHGKLLELDPIQNGHRVILKFWYSTADAMGMNMICKATDMACRFIVNSVKPQRFFLRSNYSSNKKLSFNNIVQGYGKTVTAEVVIPRKLLRIINTSPEKMVQYYQDIVQSGILGGMVGANGHFSNGLTALFIACGQDVATIVNSGGGISFCEVTPDGDLYVSAYVPNLLVGTVGGGTAFGTARECLELMDCFGSGKARRFSEIAAAVALAGEISICASIVNGTYVDAHELFGRNYPAD